MLAHPYSSGAWRPQSDSSSSSSSSSSSESSSSSDDDNNEGERPSLDDDHGRALWEVLLARELSIANDEAHRATKAYNEGHHRADTTVAYDAKRVHFDWMDGASVEQNWKLARACLVNMRRYYLVLPPKHCLPFGFSDTKERHIESYMREWDDEISGKELAEAKASAARAPHKRAATRTQDEEKSRRRQRF
jgi:hypothetical protein